MSYCDLCQMIKTYQCQTVDGAGRHNTGTHRTEDVNNEIFNTEYVTNALYSLYQVLVPQVNMLGNFESSCYTIK